MNTKARHLEIFNVAKTELEKAGGIEAVDSLKNPERLTVLRQMYHAVKDETDCHYETAKNNVAKALRRARYGVMQKQWGGKRPGAGRPKGSTSE